MCYKTGQFYLLLTPDLFYSRLPSRPYATDTLGTRLLITSRRRAVHAGALALGVAGLAVALAGRIFDARGGFELLYLWLAAAVVAAIAGTLLPARRRLAVVPAGTD